MMENAGFSFFENYFSKLDKEDAIPLMALDLASVNYRPPKDVSALDIFEHLDLSIPTNAETDEEPHLKQELYEDLADAFLHRHMDLFEDRFFLSPSINFNEPSEVLTLEQNVCAYLTLFRDFYFRMDENDIWLAYFKLSTIMFETKIENGYLWGMLMEVLFLTETLVPCLFLQTHNEMLKFMLKAMRNFSETFEFGDYRCIQELISVNSCLKYGSVDLLQTLLQMGHELSCDTMWNSIEDYWMNNFDNSLGFIIRRKPFRMPLKRFMLHLHLLKYADSCEIPCEHIYDDFPEKLNLLWRSIPDALITREEIAHVFSEDLAIMDQEKVKQISDEWDKILHDAPLQPRPLQHYARCTIRKILNGTSMLPEGIEQLLLPEMLRSYLNLEM